MALDPGTSALKLASGSGGVQRPPEDFGGGAAEPVVEQGGVDPSEVGVMSEVSGIELIGLQAWMRADDPSADAGPTRNRFDPAPWSVPRLPFSTTRRPNSEKVIRSTRLACPEESSRRKNEATALPTC